MKRTSRGKNVILSCAYPLQVLDPKSESERYTAIPDSDTDDWESLRGFRAIQENGVTLFNRKAYNSDELFITGRMGKGTIVHLVPKGQEGSTYTSNV